MFKIEQMEKVCRLRNTERRYDEYQIVYKPCNKCNVRCSSKYYYANKDKELEKRKKQYHNNSEKIIDLEKKDVTYLKRNKMTIKIKFKH